MSDTKPSCWMEWVGTYDEGIAYETERGQDMCEGIPIEKYDPELDQTYEVCARCGSERPESK